MDFFDPSKITTWISLSAAALLFLLGIARIIVKSEPIKKITKQHTYSLLMSLLNRSFIIVILIVIGAVSLSFFDGYVTNAMKSTAEQMKKSQQLIQEWALLEDSDRKTALSTLKSASESFDSYESFFMYASALNNEGEYEDAVMIFDKAIALKKTKEAYLNKGFALQQLGKYQDSIQSLIQGLSADSNSYNTAIFQSKLHYNIASSSLDIYQTQLESSPNSKLLDTAKKHLDLATIGLRENTNYQGDLYGLSGMYYEFKGEYLKSIEMYDKALAIRISQLFESKLARDFAITNNNVGSLLLKGFFELEKSNLKGYEDSIRYLEEALYIFSAGNFSNEKAYVLYNLGEAYNKLGKLEYALEHLQSSLTIFKTYSSPHAQKVENLIKEIEQKNSKS